MKDKASIGSSVSRGGNLTPPPIVRIASVDALRGLTILLMVFVNDLGRAAPSWMHHIHPHDADGMTLADVVFPTFLFIVGMSIPLALAQAEIAGKSRWTQLGHILLRTAGLLFMGVIYINQESDITLREQLWALLALTALILAWCVLPQQRSLQRTLLIGLKAIGILGLVVLLAVFRRTPTKAEFPFAQPVDDWTWLQTGWWEILGLIAWAYFVVAILALFLGQRREWLMGAMAILMTLHLALHDGGLLTRLDTKPWLGGMAPILATLSHAFESLGNYVSLRDATGSLAAVTMPGCLVGSILRPSSDVVMPSDRLKWSLTFLVGLFVAGLITDNFEGINKIAATPTWCLWSASIACAIWIILYLVMDVSQFRGWAILVRPAGANPLVAYFLHPIIVYAISLSGYESLILGYKASQDPSVVIGGSAAMAMFVCGAAGLLGRLGLRMRL